MQRFVRDALQDRLFAGDIPDIQLAGGQTAKLLYVRTDMPVSKMKLTAEALPQLPGVVLKLVSLSEAGELVARTGETVAFVTVDRVHLGDREATVWLGADFVAPERLGVIKMCCCEGEARFIRREGRWVFEKWGLLRCA